MNQVCNLDTVILITGAMWGLLCAGDEDLNLSAYIRVTCMGYMLYYTILSVHEQNAINKLNLKPADEQIDLDPQHIL